jgi:hypothetical protein
MREDFYQVAGHQGKERSDCLIRPEPVTTGSNRITRNQKDTNMNTIDQNSAITTEPTATKGRTDVAYLVFVIRSGEIEWHAAHNTREAAVDHINRIRPGGLDADPDADDIRSPIEFAFTVESAHFVSFI